MRPFLSDYWDALLDWLNEPTGLKITTVEITRWNALFTLIVVNASAAYAYEVGSWRLFALLVGGYVLGALVMFIIRENRGEG